MAYNYDDKTLLAAYRYAEDRTKENKFSVRMAFLAGVSYEKNRVEENTDNRPEPILCVKEIKPCPNCGGDHESIT